MNTDSPCAICGESEFYENAGYCYCKECGTQTQAVRDIAGNEVYEQFSGYLKNTVIKDKAKIKEEPVEDSENQLTSWECYNYIIHGLVDELIQLGAHSSLKNTVHTLWFKYLVKLEVLRIDALPKLGLSTWKKDAKILYGFTEKKVKKSRARITFENIDNLSQSDLKYLKNKRRKSFANSTALENSTSILDFEPENVFNSTTKLEYNSSITNQLELKRKRGNDISIHKLNASSFSNSFLGSAENLSRSKVYAIIYLGLLIQNDAIQLGDMIRFVREGNLSFVNVSHFIPSYIKKNDLNMQNWNKYHAFLNSCNIRETSFKVAKYLDVLKYIPCQNLVRMCERYCRELNLPVYISDYVITLMTKVTPKMAICEDTTITPNYEGRIMSLIIFALKLMFGLDDSTEYHLSSYAKLLNDREDIQQKMFVWENWTHHIYYRKLVLTQHHFPTQYVFDNEGVSNVNLYSDFLENSFLNNSNSEVKNEDMENLREILEEIVATTETKSDNNLIFLPSLTPFREYVKVILTSSVPERKNYLKKVLKTKYTKTSMDFLVNSEEYLEKLKEDIKVSVKERGSYKDVCLVPLSNIKAEMQKYRYSAKQDVQVKIIAEDDELGPQQVKTEDGSPLVYDYKLQNKESKIPKKYTHFKPYVTYWSTSTGGMQNLAKEDAKAFVRSLPSSFQFVLNECSRIIEQEPHVLMDEFSKVEAVLCRVKDFENLNIVVPENYEKMSLKNLLDKAYHNW